MLVLVEDCFFLFSSVFLNCAFSKKIFDFLHRILKWQFLNRTQIERIFTISFAIEMAHENLLTVLEHAVEPYEHIRFVCEVSTYKSAEGTIQIMNKYPDSRFPLAVV